MRHKINLWKIASAILLVALVSVVALQIDNLRNDETLNFEKYNFSIDKENFYNLIENSPSNQREVFICSAEFNKCLRVTKLEN